MSVSARPRPASSGMRIAVKYPGVAKRRLATRELTASSGCALLADRPDAAAHRHRHEADEAGVHDSGQSARVGQDPVVEGLPGRGRLVFRKGQRSPERHDAFGAESGIDALQLPERPHEESRGGEKRHRRGDFGDHEERAKPLGRPARARAGPFGERLGPGVAAGPQRRKHAERDSGHRGQGRGKEEDPRIDRRSAHQRDGFGQKPREQRRGRRRENDAERAAGKGQQQALRQELAQQPLPPGPERGAHGELLAPGDGAHEKETRQVRACDQEHGERRAEQGRDEEARLVPEPVAQGDDRRAVLRVVLRVCALERRGDSAHLPPRRRERDAGLQAPDEMEPVVPPILVALLGEPGGHPETRHAAGIRETRRHDADDREGLVVEPDGLADHRRIASELRFPEGVGEQHRPRRAGTVVGRREETTERGRRAEQRQQLVRHRLALEPAGLAVTDEIARGAVARADRLEGAAHPLPVAEVRRRDLHLRVTPERLVLPEAHQPIGLGEGQRTQERVVENRERRGRGADAERRHEDRRQREARRARQRPDGVAEVLAQDVEMHEQGVRQHVEYGAPGEAEPRQQARVAARAVRGSRPPSRRRTPRGRTSGRAAGGGGRSASGLLGRDAARLGEPEEAGEPPRLRPGRGPAVGRQPVVAPPLVVVFGSRTVARSRG